jgi:hypothetical protein
MIDHEKILEAINSNDPIIKQTAIDQAKTCGVADKRLLLDLAKKKGGLQELFQAITGIKEINPDTSNIQLPQMIRKKVTTIEINEQPKPKMFTTDFIMKDNDCKKHPGTPSITKVGLTGNVCLGCAYELFMIWKNKPDRK